MNGGQGAVRLPAYQMSAPHGKSGLLPTRSCGFCFVKIERFIGDIFRQPRMDAHAALRRAYAGGRAVGCMRHR